MTTLEETLAERGARYGDFTDRARVAQRLQDAMHNPVGWHACSDIQKQALTVIADKIARILTGDPNYADNWHDIQGYAKLVEDRLPTLISRDVKPPYSNVKPDGWIEWAGGECPVASDANIEVRLRQSSVGGTAPAGCWRWNHIAAESDIIAYRIVKD